MKKALYLIGVIAVAPFVLGALAVVGADDAAASCPTSDSSKADVVDVVRDMSSLLRRKHAIPPRRLDAPAQQVAKAKKIEAAGASLKAPARERIVALVAALQESGPRNLVSDDRDSAGLFQQLRTGWVAAATEDGSLLLPQAH